MGWPTLGLVLLCCGGTAAAEAEAVRLEIPARSQAAESPKAGWCGETAIQEALLYHGAWVPQRRINRAGEPRNPDLYWSDIPRALRRLGVRFETWSGRGDQASFTRWVRDQLRRGRPVLAGVKLYPTEHPSWGLDHMVLIVGVDGDGGMRINTTWGYPIRRSAAELGSKRRGTSLANRYGRHFAHAIVGPAASGPRVSLEVGPAKRGRIAATARIHGLVRGRDYTLRRNGRVVERFRATAPSMTRRLSIPADAASRIEVRR
jgi:hypothetical protein